jgi:hypothetical protein
MLPVEAAYKIYTGLDGKPLNNGYVYIGQPNQNPITAPITVYWDAAGTIPASQPLRTLNGYVVRSGTPANVFCNEAYSELVKDSKARQVYYAANSDTFSFSSILTSISNFALASGSSLIGFLQAGVGAIKRTVQSKLRDTVSVMDYGAKGDWDGATGTDDADAFQAAINYRASTGGGDVIVPPAAKAYRLNKKITILPGVRLIGCHTRPPISWYQSALSGYYGGYCLAITWGVGTTASMAIEVQSNTAISGFTILYPTQVSDLTVSTPLDFPPTIAGNDGTSPGGLIENLNLVNSRRGIYLPFGHGELVIKSVWGTPLGEFITLNGVYNADQIIDVNVSGIHYLRTSPAANFTNNTGLWSWIQRNGKAFVLGYADAIRFTDCFVGNCAVGIYFGNAPVSGSMIGVNQFTYGNWTGGGMEGVTFPFQVAGSTTSGINSNGFRVSDAGIAPVGLFNAARSVSVLMMQPNVTFSDQTEVRGKITFTNCGFWGSGSWLPNTGPLEGVVDATGGDVEFYGCTFKVWQSYIARAYTGACAFKFVGCDFLDNRSLSSNLYHFTTTSTAGTMGRFILGGGNDFKAYFGSNCPLNTSEFYETSQPYSFGTPTVASADPLPIAAIGRSFYVSGSTTFSYVNNPYKDRVITLRFLSACTATDGGNLQLAGNFAATTGGMLTLIGDGTNWTELSRSAN